MVTKKLATFWFPQHYAHKPEKNTKKGHRPCLFCKLDIFKNVQNRSWGVLLFRFFLLPCLVVGSFCLGCRFALRFVRKYIYSNKTYYLDIYVEKDAQLLGRLYKNIQILILVLALK
jgi:hypothetical protein